MKQQRRNATKREKLNELLYGTSFHVIVFTLKITNICIYVMWNAFFRNNLIIFILCFVRQQLFCGHINQLRSGKFNNH